MNLKSVYKIPDGKLLKISLDYNERNNSIGSINITGDFFAYPEEAIEIIEENLKDTSFDRINLRDKIESIINENNLELIGLNVEGLTHGIMLCKP
jgi:hypothetical protein